MRMAEEYCKHLKTAPKEKYRLKEHYTCEITHHHCVGEVIDEIKLQPSHYSPEDIFLYNNSIARKTCPAYGLSDELVKKILDFRDTNSN